MAFSSRYASLFLFLVLHPPAAIATSRLVERFDEAVARLSPPESPSTAPLRGEAVPATDFTVERRLNISVDFPDDVQGTMYAGSFHGSAAIFTRAGDYLDATVVRGSDVVVTSFDASPGAATDRGIGGVAVPSGIAPPRRRTPRSVGPGHFEDPTAHSLHVRFFKHDDLIDRSARDIHARYVAWWLADLALRVLPVEPMRVSYWERVPWLTSMAYGDTDSLDAFEHALALMSDDYGFGMDRTYKSKFILLTADAPMPGTAGVAFQGGNEAIASIAGRERIVAHEIGHMLGATHEDAETRGWWGCDTNMVATATRGRRDCREYSAANRRAVRSYMRHGPDTVSPKRMADVPASR